MTTVMFGFFGFIIGTGIVLPFFFFFGFHYRETPWWFGLIASIVVYGFTLLFAVSNILAKTTSNKKQSEGVTCKKSGNG